jgi:HEPN domain-containing protein
MTVNISREEGVRQELMSAARSFLQEGAYNEAILHSITSLEYALRKKLNLGPNNSFAAVMSRLIRANLTWITPEEVNDLVIMRNNVAYKVGGVNYGEKEASKVLGSVDRILGHLDILGASTIYYE